MRVLGKGGGLDWVVWDFEKLKLEEEVSRRPTTRLRRKSRTQAPSSRGRASCPRRRLRLRLRLLGVGAGAPVAIKT